MSELFTSGNGFRQVGQDSEFFVWDKEKDEVVSAHHFFPEKSGFKPITTDQLNVLLDRFKKIKTTEVPRSSDKVVVFRDGFAVEVNCPPATCCAFIWNDVKAGLLTFAPEVMWEQPERFTFTTRPWVEVTGEMLKDLPADLLQLGCMPTLDVYKGGPKAVTADGKTLGFRTSGSHLHASLQRKMSDDQIERFIKLADLIIGVPFVSLFNDELEFKRRALYGQAGEFRLQEYPGLDPYTLRPLKTTGTVPGIPGIEYRVLSSRLWNHPVLFSMFFQLWKYFMGNFQTLEIINQAFDPKWEDTIRGAINEGTELKEAKKIWRGVMDKVRPGKWSNFRFTPERFDVIAEKSGTFIDAGLYNEPRYAEAHHGFSEYLSTWGDIDLKLAGVPPVPPLEETPLSPYGANE